MTRHIHQYIRIRIGKNKRPLFKCAIAGCTHVCKPELIIGRFSICNICFNQFIITKPLSELARPHCEKCTKSPKQESINTILELLDT